MCPLVQLGGSNDQNMFQALYSFSVSESKCFSLLVVFLSCFVFLNQAASLFLCLTEYWYYFQFLFHLSLK